ncbi:MAG: tRNA (adenosine(37)-N6)-dimethylallyltransferase MiaA [Treponema sp.]|nr:tRNA (adenosine(37)-N6)-dimethylallyltransferase MiaA [Treponema sp.]
MDETQGTKLPVIVIFAPTASGKTALTKELFAPGGSHFILNAEIISADSQAVYKGMDIGTAKPEPELRKILPHHLIDILTPDQQYNVSDFVNDADCACRDIYARGKTPVVCGGTGFYIRNFLYGVAPTPVSDPVLREKLKARIATEGNAELYKELQEIDPVSAVKIHPNDAYRICRALEVYYLSGKTRSEFAIKPGLRPQYDFTFIVLEPPRDLLYERINQRVDQMIEQGLEDEIKSLLKSGYTKDSPGFKAIGYHEWFEYPDRLQAIEAIKHNSRKYAKKQFILIRNISGSKIVKYEGKPEQINDINLYLKSLYSATSFSLK